MLSFRLVRFAESLVNLLGGENDRAEASIELCDSRLNVYKANDGNGIELKRPSFCPINSMLPEQVASLPEEIAERGVDCGVAVIVESCDGEVLLTRRAPHLRTFPNLWVPPGGHIEPGESIVEAGLRELHEETGLRLALSNNCSALPILCLWESVYPPHLSWGVPKRHHLVVYLHLMLSEPWTSERVSEHLRLQVEETDMAVWLPRDVTQRVAAVFEQDSHLSDSTAISLSDASSSVLTSYVVDGSGQMQVSELSVDELLRPASLDDTSRSAGVSTGTRYALGKTVTPNKAINVHLLTSS